MIYIPKIRLMEVNMYVILVRRRVGNIISCIGRRADFGNPLFI